MKRIVAVAGLMGAFWWFGGIASASQAVAVASSTVTAPASDPLSQGLWWLYQLQYKKAHSLFEEYSRTHPKDPAGYFYMTATDWWQLAQEFDHKLPEVEKRLETDYQQTVKIGKEMLGSA